MQITTISVPFNFIMSFSQCLFPCGMLCFNDTEPNKARPQASVIEWKLLRSRLQFWSACVMSPGRAQTPAMRDLLLQRQRATSPNAMPPSRGPCPVTAPAERIKALTSQPDFDTSEGPFWLRRCLWGPQRLLVGHIQVQLFSLPQCFSTGGKFGTPPPYLAMWEHFCSSQLWEGEVCVCVGALLAPRGQAKLLNIHYVSITTKHYPVQKVNMPAAEKPCPPNPASLVSLS